MGRKPVDKERSDDPQLKVVWIQQLASLFLQNGLTKFTMDEIAAKLNISKATLYKYYSSKEEILDDVVRYKLDEIEAFEPYLNDDQITFSERYFEVIKGASMILAEFSTQFVLDIKLKYTELFVRIQRFQERARSAAEKFYEEGINRGIMNDINPRLLALTDQIFIHAMSHPSLLREQGMTLKEAFDGFYQMKSKGIFK